MAAAAIKYFDRPTDDPNDAPFAGRIARSLFPGQREAAVRYLTSCAEEAERIVRERWCSIETVAAVIVERGDITGDEFRDIVGVG
jgi:hypothetical protein